MAGTVGTAYLTLVPKLESSAVSKEGASAGTTFGTSFSGKLGTAAKVGAAAMAATVAGVGLAAGAIKGAVTSAAEYGDTVDKMSQKIGMSTDAYQEWAYVFQRAGTDIGVMQTGMRTLSTQAQANASEFQKLGISEEEVANLSKEDLFGRVIDGLAEMEDGTERSTLATKLLGRAGTELGPLLNQGTDAINEQREMAEKYGLVMPEAAVKASAAFEDSMTTLRGAVTGAKNALAAELLPSVTKVTDGITEILVGNVDQGVEMVSTGIQEMIGKITESLPQFIDGGMQLIQSLMEGLVQNMPAIVDSLVNLLTMLIGYVPTFVPLLLSAAVQLFMALAQAVPSVVGALVGAIGSLLNQGVSTASGFVGQFLNAGISLVQGIAQGIANGAGAVINKIQEICSSAVDRIKSFFGINSPSRLMRKMFGYVGDGMVLGLEDSEKDVNGAIEDLMDSAASRTATFGIGLSSSLGSAGRGGSDIVNAIETLHDDLYGIIRDATPGGITERQFGRLVRGYA